MGTMYFGFPQVMAIATLAEVYNNPDVFRGVVKIRKGLACRMILESRDLEGAKSWFYKFALDIARRVPPSDPCATRTIAMCEAAAHVSRRAKDNRHSGIALLLMAAIPVVIATCAYIYNWRCVMGFPV